MEVDLRNNVVNVALTSCTNESVDFSRVANLTKKWMIDFKFLSLCRYFKEGQFQKFTQTLAILEALVDGASLKTDERQKLRISAFLTRVMHGKHLDVQFEQDSKATPLMSAINVWATMREIVADGSLYESINHLLFVQSVAVCLEKGECSMASSVLTCMAEGCEIPQNLESKLSRIVNKRDTYNSFLHNFSWSQLLEMVHTFLDGFLEQHPSDFLLQAATKVVQSSQSLDDSVIQDESLTSSTCPDYFKETTYTTECIRPKKKLLPTNNIQPWKPESSKNHVVPNRFSKQETSSEPTRLTFWRGSPEIPLNTMADKRGRRSRKWTFKMDQKLKAGVKRYGEGKWSLILLDHDFEGRTGVMLKDRWRVLKRALLVS